MPRFKFLRFSLRTLLLLALSVGSIGVLWSQREPWKCTATVRFHSGADSLRFSDDGQWLLVSTRENGRQILRSASGELRTTFGSKGSWSDWDKFSPDGTHVVTFDHDGPAKLWEADTGKALRTFSDEMYGGLFSLDGSRLLTFSGGPVRLLDTSTGRPLLEWKRNSPEEVSSPLFLFDKVRLATGHTDGSIRIWNIHTGEKLFETEPVAHEAWRMAQSPDGQVLAAAWRKNSEAVLWDLASYKKMFSLRGHKDTIQNIEFSADGSRLLTVSDDATVRIWDANDGTCLRTLDQFPDGIRLRDAHFSFDGLKIVTSEEDSTEDPSPWLIHRVWATDDGTSLGVIDRAEAVQVLPYGLRAVDFARRLWDLEKCTPVAELEGVRSHADPVFSKDGRFLAVADLEGETLDLLWSRTLVRIWTRCRDEEPWGILELPYCWLAMGINVLLFISIFFDWRKFRAGAPA
ncbi:MAG: WD40 repeat domain-containing protein [Planctomycetes bacterium]|nr:WD40 repeat domain-containing protein [Planctomycetota bacterium]